MPFKMICQILFTHFLDFLKEFFSVLCPEGKYKETGMTECLSCDLGEESNPDRTTCGECSY